MWRLLIPQEPAGPASQNPRTTLPVHFELNEDVQHLLSEAVLHGQHAESCPARKNRYLPATHPMRQAEAQCVCWRAAVLRMLERRS